MKIANLIIVKGRVQGVGFRYFARQEAMHLGLCGYVKNLYNGDVEVFVEGNEEPIKKYTEILKQGPHFGRVSEVVVKQVPYEERFDRFEVHF
jgi:acylphosphatase